MKGAQGQRVHMLYQQDVQETAGDHPDELLWISLGRGLMGPEWVSAMVADLRPHKYCEPQVR